MNKEIEEIIDTFKEYADGFTSVLAPTEESVKALLDYINQLEEQNKKLNEEIQHIKYEKMQLLTTANNIHYTYGLR